MHKANLQALMRTMRSGRYRLRSEGDELAYRRQVKESGQTLQRIKGKAPAAVDAIHDDDEEQYDGDGSNRDRHHRDSANRSFFLQVEAPRAPPTTTAMEDGQKRYEERTVQERDGFKVYQYSMETQRSDGARLRVKAQVIKPSSSEDVPEAEGDAPHAPAAEERHRAGEERGSQHRSQQRERRPREWKRDEWESDSRRTRRKWTPRYNQCRTCGEEGHWARECYQYDDESLPSNTGDFFYPTSYWLG